MISKVGVGLIGLGTIGIGSVSLSNPSLLGIKESIPKFHTLASDNDFDTAYKNENDKFGNKYRNYLVGVTHKKGEQTETNEAWWKWVLNRLGNGKVTKGKFKGVNKGYGESEQHLSKICKDAYGTKESEFDNNDDNKFKKWDVWRYCSVGGTKPKTIQEFNSGKQSPEKEEYKGNNAIGSDTESQAKLLSAKNKFNKWVWDIKNQEFFSDSNTISEEGYFKIEREKTGETRRHIQKICEGAYKKAEKKDGTGSAKITKDETKKYCSLDSLTNPR